MRLGEGYGGPQVTPELSTLLSFHLPQLPLPLAKSQTRLSNWTELKLTQVPWIRWRGTGRKSLNGEEMNHQYIVGCLPQLFQLSPVSHISKNKHWQVTHALSSANTRNFEGWAGKAIIAMWTFTYIAIWLNTICPTSEHLKGSAKF